MKVKTCKNARQTLVEEYLEFFIFTPIRSMGERGTHQGVMVFSVLKHNLKHVNGTLLPMRGLSMHSALKSVAIRSTEDF